jgi:hypothetical protein
MSLALGGLLAALIQASFMEWAFHRFWLHRPWLPKDAFVAHTLIHHQLCKYDDTFHVEHGEQEEALEFQWWVGPLMLAIALVPWWLLGTIVPALGAIVLSPPYFATFTSTVILYYTAYVVSHELMHRSRFPLIERTGYFQFIKKHHRIHHYRMNRNLNIVLPFADFCLGTLVLNAEVPLQTPQSAKDLARKHSKYGARLREESCRAEVAVHPPSTPDDSMAGQADSRS